MHCIQCKLTEYKLAYVIEKFMKDKAAVET